MATTTPEATTGFAFTHDKIREVLTRS